MKYDCNLTRNRLLEKVSSEIKEKNIHPTLVIITCSDDEASKIYVRNKLKVCEQVGIKATHYVLNPITTTEEELKETIYNCNLNFNGIIIQLPLCDRLKHLEKECIELISPEKDVDGLTLRNQALLLNNDKKAIVPATARACYEIIKDLTTYENLDVTIVNRSNLIGKPLQALLTNKNYTVTLCHSKTRYLKTKTFAPNIVIVGVGKPDYFDKTYFREHQIVLDCGINRVDGKLKRDVRENVSEIIGVKLASNVGVVTTVCIALNLLDCYKLQQRGKLNEKN